MTTTTTYPTLRAAYYVNWTDIAIDCMLTDAEVEQATAALGEYTTWGDADLTLVSTEVVYNVLCDISRSRPQRTEEDYQTAVRMLTAYHFLTEGAAYVNLEVEAA
jgi:hypothetical protein